MAVDILSIGHTDEYTGTGATKAPFLMGSFMDKITSEVVVSVHWESVNVFCIITASGQTIKRLDNQSFINDEWRAGDTFDLSGTVSNNSGYTIASISANGDTITTVETLVNETCSTTTLNATTQINALNFYFNLVENGANINFNSLTDTGTACLKVASGNPFNVADTNNLVQATTSLGWDNGSGTVTRNADVGYEQRFTITHEYLISPYYTSGEPVDTGKVITTNYYPSVDAITSWGTIQPPAYFFGLHTLKYICRVDAKYSLPDPNITHTTDLNYPFPLGNVGYLNEFLNGGTPEYTMDALIINEVVSGNFVTDIDFNLWLNCGVTLSSSSGNFLNGGAGVGSPIVIDIFYCPQATGQYTNTPTNMNENFLLDRVYMECGESFINGENYGTNYQILKECAYTFLNANQCTFDIGLDFSTYIKTFLMSKPVGDRHIMITATPQKKTATDLQTTDRNAVLVWFDKTIYNQEDPTLLTWTDTLFYQYPDVGQVGFDAYNGVIGDLVLSKSQFTVDREAILTSIRVEIQAVNSVTGEVITLQRSSSSLQNTNNVCEPITQTNNYKLPNNPYNQTTFERNVALDTETVIGYEYNYGFVLRYETWVDVPEAETAFSCENFQDWSIYSKSPDWSVRHAMIAEVLKNDFTTEFIHTAEVNISDEKFSDNGFGDSIVSEIKTYYFDGLSYVDAKGLIFSDRNTFVVLNLTSDFTNLPTDATGYAGYVAVDLYGTGGIFYRDTCSSETLPISGSVWVTNAQVVKVSNSLITITGEIDYTKLSSPSYTLTGRLYYKY